MTWITNGPQYGCLCNACGVWEPVARRGVPVRWDYVIVRGGPLTHRHYCPDPRCAAEAATLRLTGRPGAPPFLPRRRG